MPATLLLTDALADELANAVRRGVPVETACQAAGIGERTFYQWLQAAERGEWGPGLNVDQGSLSIIQRFSRLVATAQADFEAAQIAAIAEAGAVVGRSGIPEWRARAWLLNNHPRYRKRYRQEHVAQIEQTVTHRHEDALVEAASPDELRSWAALELPAPNASEP